VSYIQELKGVIRSAHGVEATHVESVPIKESFEGKTVWEGIVEVFDVENYIVPRVYAWAHQTDNAEHPLRLITVLHRHPILTPRDAVRAAIVRGFKSFDTAEES
jgi:hypothetical protein